MKHPLTIGPIDKQRQSGLFISMKLYISIPISGRPLHEAKYHAECIKAALTPHGHECITPFDVCSEPGNTYGHYMGRDIEAILDNNIDGIVFGHGFHDSNGCMLEHAAAQIYTKSIIYESCFYMMDLDKLIIKPTIN